MITRKGIFVIAALLLSIILSAPACAVMASPVELPPIEIGLYNELLSALDEPSLFGEKENVRALEVDRLWGNASVVIARVEGSACKGELCRTLFFVRKAGTVGLLAIGDLPPNIAFGDQRVAPCDKCLEISAIWFSGKSETTYIVGIGPGYVVVGYDGVDP